MILRSLIALISALLLSSCDTFYVQPETSIPQALVRIVAEDNLQFAVVLYEDPNCKVGPHSGLLGGPGVEFGQDLISSRKIPKHVYEHGNTEGMSSPPKNSELAYIERKIPSDKEMAFVFSRVVSVQPIVSVQPTGIGLLYKTCNMTVAFTPEENAQYELSFYVKDQECVTHLERLDISDNVEGKVEVKRTPQILRKLDKNCGLI